MNTTDRKIDSAIADFLRGSPLDAGALVQHLAHQKLRIEQTKSEDELEEKDTKIVRNTVDAIRNAVQVEWDQQRVLIDPATREKVRAMTLEDVDAAIESVWSDGE